MIFLTDRDVADRIAQGIPAGELYKPPSRIRLCEAQVIIDEVETAFRDVQLGNGVGLFEGQAIDDYESEDIQKHVREKDEKADWKKIRTSDMDRCYSSLSFFDAEGMRFHLPAFVCSDLRGDSGVELEFSLVGFGDQKLGAYKRSKFSLLNFTQRTAIARYLKFLAEDIDGAFSRKAIQQSLATFWETDLD